MNRSISRPSISPNGSRLISTIAHASSWSTA